MLIGQCEIDFKKWYNSNKDYDLIFYNIPFRDIPNSMKYGIYIDFFDNSEIYITISFDEHIKGFNWWVELDNTHSGKSKTRRESTNKAIEIAVEIYNLNIYVKSSS